jgi:NADH-quinone oxidoreductase subunit N
MPPAADSTLSIPVRDLLYLAPVLALTAWGFVVLLVDLLLYRLRPESPATASRRGHTLGGLALAGVGLTLATMLVDVPGWFGLRYSDGDPTLFGGSMASDAGTTAMGLLVVAVLGLVIGLSISSQFTRHRGEYYALLFWAAAGMLMLIAAEELITIFVSLETMTLCLYILAGFDKSSQRSPEAGLKYFIYGSVSSALFLYGLSFVYGLTGATRLDVIPTILSQPGSSRPGLAFNPSGTVAVLLLLAGLGFKVAAVPFHQWAPDTYEGAPTPVSAWIAAGSKIASFVAFLKVFGIALTPWAAVGSGDILSPGWIGLLAIMAAATMTVGNLGALWQTGLKRLLAYSAIAHAGYMLVGLTAIAARPGNQQAAGAVLFYLMVYGVTTVAAFGIAVWTIRDRGSDRIEDLNGLGYESPALAVCMVVLMLSLIGIPPLGGFFGKLYLFMEALDAREPGRISLVWLVALGLVNSVISAFYYVRVLRALFMRPLPKRRLRPAPAGVSRALVFGTLVALGTGVIPSPLLDSMRNAGIAMLSVSNRRPPRIINTEDRRPPEPEPEHAIINLGRPAGR